jgi:hypothetical protein
MKLISNSILMNQEIVKRNHIDTNRSYREYLQQNALTIQASNFTKPDDTLGLGKTIPYTFDSVNDNSKPKGYEDSVMKQQFLSHQMFVSSQSRPMFDSFVIERV